MSKYLAIFLVSLKDTLFYKGKILTTVFVWFVRVGILLGVYAVAYRYVGHDIRGVSFSVAIWSIGIYFLLLTIMGRRVFKDISDEVQFGTIETKINKPIQFVLYHWVGRMGKNLLDFVLSGATAIVFLLLVVGLPDVAFSFAWIGKASALFVIGLLLSYVLYSLVGLSAFWLEVADPAFWIVDKSVMILGGSFIPVALFPDVMRRIAEFSPFGAIMFADQAFNPDFHERWVWLLVAQIVWLVILAVALAWIYRLAQKRLFVNGG